MPSKKNTAATEQTVTETLVEQGIPVPLAVQDHDKKTSKKAAKKAAKAPKEPKKIGTFLEADVDLRTAPNDGKNPLSFKKWIKKNLNHITIENPLMTIGEARIAYEDDMLAYHEQNKFSNKELRAIETAVRHLEQPRKHTFKTLEKDLVFLRKMKLVLDGPTLAWVGGHNVHIHVSYTPDALNIALPKIFKAKRLKKHLARVQTAIDYTTSTVTH